MARQVEDDALSGQAGVDRLTIQVYGTDQLPDTRREKGALDHQRLVVRETNPYQVVSQRAWLEPQRLGNLLVGGANGKLYDRASRALAE